MHSEVFRGKEAWCLQPTDGCGKQCVFVERQIDRLIGIEKEIEKGNDRAYVTTNKQLMNFGKKVSGSSLQLFCRNERI